MAMPITVAGHAQVVARRAELTRSVRVQHEGIGPHGHILHGGVQGDDDICGRFARPVIPHVRQEDVRVLSVNSPATVGC